MRRYSQRPFPRYRHRPGVTPHPRRDPEGHLYGRPEVVTAAFDPARWADSEDYLYGVDLHNAGYYWEAHEAWEGLWKRTARKDALGLYLQGLIQISAALLKRELRMRPGMIRLAAAGVGKLQRVAGLHPTYCGLDVLEYVGRIEQIVGNDTLDVWPADPRMYLPL